MNVSTRKPNAQMKIQMRTHVLTQQTISNVNWQRKQLITSGAHRRTSRGLGEEIVQTLKNQKQMTILSSQKKRIL